MKPLLYVFATLITAVCFANHCGAEEKREAQPRFKGVELYSWKNPKGDWVFALLDGTNRLKTVDEVKAPKNDIAGVDLLKKALAGLAVDENVAWTHPIEGFEFPPETTIKAIVKAAKDSKVKLYYSLPKK